MKSLAYPLFIYTISPDLYLGNVIGTQIRKLESSVSSLTNAVKNILKSLPDDDSDKEPSLTDPVLIQHTITCRPSFHSGKKIFPLKKIIYVTFDLVYGKMKDREIYECFVPALDFSFYFYSIKDLKTLSNYYIREALDDLPAEEAFILMTLPQAQLKMIRIQRQPFRKQTTGGSTTAEKYSGILDNMAAPLFTDSDSGESGIHHFSFGRNALKTDIEFILRSSKVRLLLVGDHGTGKSNLMYHCISKVCQTGSEDGKSVTFWKTEPGRVLTDTKFFGEWQRNAQDITDELRLRNGVLWLDPFIDSFFTGGTTLESSLAYFWLSDLKSSKLSLIGELTPDEYEAAVRIFPDFMNQFEIVRIPEMNDEEMAEMYTAFAERIQQKNNVRLDQESMNLAHYLCGRYFRHIAFPGKSLNLLNRCLNQAAGSGNYYISRDLIIDNLQQMTGLAGIFLRDEIVVDERKLSAHFTSIIKGQKEAVDIVLSLISVIKAALYDPEKPLGTLIFAGPTGVGKTAMAKAIASYFFAEGLHHDPLIRLDMSEYSFPYQVYRLIGSGTGDSGKLIREVREKPFSVVLLDEIEKAHPVILDFLLNVLEDGRMTDELGRVTDFRNCIFIMTTNVGAKKRASLGFGKKAKPDYQHAIKSFFRPEFLNRIDHILLFHPLSKKVICEITEKELDALALREGFEKKNLRLSYSQSLVEHLADKGFDEQYGARPLQREIEKRVVSVLSDYLLKFPDLQDVTLHLHFRDGSVTVERRG